MTPVLVLWPSKSTEKIAIRVALAMRAAGYGSTLFRPLDHSELAAPGLTATLDTIYRELISIDSTDPDLHTIAFVPLYEPEAAARVNSVISALAASSGRFTLHVIGLRAGIDSLLQSDEAQAADKAETERCTISAIDTACHDAPFRCTLAVVDDYLANGVPVRFSSSTLGRFATTVLTAMGERFHELFSRVAAWGDDSEVLSLGLSRLSFDRRGIVDYLMHRAFIAALDNVDITCTAVDAQSASARAIEALRGIEKFYDDFYTAQVVPLIDQKLAEGEIAARIHKPLLEAVDALKARLTAFIDDPSLSLPEKEAIFASLMGKDSHLLKGLLYNQDDPVIDDIFSAPMAPMINAFNEYDHAGSRLPLRGEYPELAFPYIMNDDGELVSDSRNKLAFDPIPEMKALKREILDQTAFIRAKEKEISRLRERQEAALLTDVTHTRGLRRNTDYDIVEQPLNDVYTPREGLKILPTVDLRPDCSPVRSQGKLGSCSCFAVGAMYEVCINRAGALPPGVKADVSERFMFYHSNVLRGKPEGGSNFNTMLEVMGSHGVCPEDMYPYTTDDLSVPPGDDATAEALNHRVLLARQIPLRSDGSKYDCVTHNHRLLTSALSEGYPVGFSLKIFDDFGTAPGGHVGYPTGLEPDFDDPGYHAMVLVGYSEADKCYIVRNSWGEDFGDKGYCYVSAAYIDDPEYNNFACIICDTTEAKADAPIAVKELVAPFAGTETQIKIAAISNALDEAKIHKESLEARYAAYYRYYQALLQRLSNPKVRDDLRTLAEDAAAQAMLQAESERVDAIDTLPTRLKDFCRKYIINALGVTGVGVLLTAIAFLFSYYRLWDSAQTIAWIVAGIADAAAVIMWLHYAWAKKRERLELQEAIERITDRMERHRRQMLESQLRFHVAGMVIDAAAEMVGELHSRSLSLEGYNNHLRQWHAEDSAKTAELDTEAEAMFVTLSSRGRLDAFFADHRDGIARAIDLSARFKDFSISREAITELRSQLEESTREAIGELLKEFTMTDWLLGRKAYGFVDRPELDSLFRRLNHLSQVTTRHTNNDGSRESRFMLLRHVHDDAMHLRSLIAPLFSFNPLIHSVGSPDELTLITMRPLPAADLL